MLFKFKSQVTSDLIMLEADARRLLKIMLDDDPDKGIILAKDLPVAIAKLERAVNQDETARINRSEQAEKGATIVDDPDNGRRETLDTVRLAQRASPIIKLLKHCAKDSSDVIWGV